MPPEHEFEFGGGEELAFLSAKQVRKSMKDKSQVFIMLASLEVIGKGVVRDLSAVCQFLEVFPEDICDFHQSVKWTFQ